jgi:hypothetical protein
MIVEQPRRPQGARLTPRQAHRLGRFTLTLRGDRLAPRHRDGETLVVDARAAPAPGDVVIALVQLAASQRLGERRGGPPGRLDRGEMCAMVLNADGDLVDNAGGYTPRGVFYLLGVVVRAFASLSSDSSGQS